LHVPAILMFISKWLV